MTKDLITVAGGEDLPISPMAGMAAVALNMALNYLDINTVKDGQMYQQLKIEGKNLEPLSLENAFHIAKQIEIHLMGASDRFAQIVVNAVADGIMSDLAETEHVGEFIEKVLITQGFDLKHAAATMGVELEELKNIVEGPTLLTQAFAEKLEEHFKMPADELMNIQAAYLKSLESQPVDPKKE